MAHRLICDGGGGGGDSTHTPVAFLANLSFCFPLCTPRSAFVLIVMEWGEAVLKLE